MRNQSPICILHLIITSDKVLATARAIKMWIQCNGLYRSIKVNCLIVIRRIQAINYNLTTITLNYNIHTVKEIYTHAH